MNFKIYFSTLCLFLFSACATTPDDGMFFGTWQATGTKEIPGNMSLYSDHSLEFISYDPEDNAIRSTFVGTWRVEKDNLILIMTSSIGDPKNPEAWEMNHEPIVIPIISVSKDVIIIEAKIGGVQKLIRKK